jgi:uncharacterized protein
MSSTLSELDAAGPVTGKQRIAGLDMLRGVAVLGILVMNIYAFSMPFIAYGNPLVMGGDDPLNLGVWFMTHIFFDQKFMSLFSMMFGAGLILMMQRAEAKQAAFGRIYYRRQFWLLLIGVVHAYLIWFGDILFHYALAGMIIYLFRHRPPRALIIIACCLLPVALLLAFAGGTYMEDLKERAEQIMVTQADGEELSEEQQATLDEWTEAREFVAPGPEELEKDLAAYRGTYGGITKHRAPVVAAFHVQGFFFFILWRVVGLMLIGMAFMKLGIMTGDRSSDFYRKLALIGYGLGLPLTVFSAANLYAHGFDALYAFRVGAIPNYIGSVLVAFGHLGAIMLVIKAGIARAIMQRFAAVGRMALSNYLLHSVILTTVLYGYGLGLYGQIPRIWQMALVIAVVGLQLVISPWWLARFRFGPVEWLWRSLTYWRRQPMKQAL